MSNYILSPAAQADIDEIWDYTADNSSTDQADRYIAQIKQACSSISFKHRHGRDIATIRKGYRKLSIGSHIIVFRIVDSKADIVRILHQRMDIESRLKD
ncbi:MAG: type II toxin-antitoxin system RelE/ParE family toxin [Mesorhizobium sp.]|nr:type II toxin-antitoxin system RelE/ParE family toxin [Mesorhizobium sp.]